MTNTSMRLRADRSAFSSMQEMHTGALPTELSLLQLLIVLNIALAARQQGSDGSANTTGHHLKYHWWYEYHWLREVLV